MRMQYIFLDPGESTGWMLVDLRQKWWDSSGKEIKVDKNTCGVLEKASHQEVWEWLEKVTKKSRCSENGVQEIGFMIWDLL